MLGTHLGILAEIVQQKRGEIAALRPRAVALEREAHLRASNHRPFAEALRRARPALIAEIKKASPSRGLLRADFDPAALARAYSAGGAACLSVLTDEAYFQGSLADLEAARAACSLPVLRKDFTIDPLQIFESAAHGADAILLIAAVLNVRELTAFRELAAALGMAALVEVHDAEDLAAAADSGAEIIGVNNRNLQTFEVSLDISLQLAESMPANALRVSESGISSRADIDLLLGAGFHAFLVGESLMQSADPAAAAQRLISEPRPPGSGS
ncbi:MAG TPA: indole-3-glycerol phosphate synthase TrpC [Bryobacteraceae bacterium]